MEINFCLCQRHPLNGLSPAITISNITGGSKKCGMRELDREMKDWEMIYFYFSVSFYFLNTEANLNLEKSCYY